VAIGVGPRDLTLIQLRFAGQPFGGHELFESGHPVVIIFGAVVRFVPFHGRGEFRG
jgi:hypothetical protein